MPRSRWLRNRRPLSGRPRFTSSEGGIGSIVSGGTMTLFSITPSIRVITSGSDGTLWMATGSGIVRFTTSCDYTLYAMSHAPESITTGRDNDLWYTESDLSIVGRITTSGQITEYTISGVKPNK